MKTSTILLFLSLLAITQGFAGSDVIIRERAKQLRDQNNARQGVPPATQPTQPAPATPAPPPPTLTPALARFQADLGTIKPGSPATAELKQKLAGNLSAAALGARPSPQTVTNLVAEVSGALAEKPLAPELRARFTTELDAVLNPAKYPQAKLEGILRDIQTMFQGGSSASTRATMVVAAVKTLASEVQQGGAK
jgi:hypothetical protein